MSAVDVGASFRNRPAWAVAEGILLVTAAVAATGRVVTAGGRDEVAYHYPTIEQFRSAFPRLDIVDVQTATSPLYHLVVAWGSLPLGSSMVVTRVLGALFCAALAVVVINSVQPIGSVALRAAAISPLLASAYLWESTLWLNTDIAALLWIALALLALLRGETVADYALVGVFCLLAVATRQTAVWLVAPVVVVAALDWRGPALARRLAVGCLPAIAGATTLAVVWQGLTPPAFAAANDVGTSWVAISYGFAVLAFFAVPTVVAIAKRRPSVRDIERACGVGLLAASSAVVFPSGAAPERTGGWIWKLVQVAPDIGGRSPLLIVAAFVGGSAGYFAVKSMDRRTGVLVAASFVALTVALIPGNDLYQRYVELPTALLFVLAMSNLAQRGLIGRQWPLWAMIAVQAVLLAGIVVRPLL